MKGVLLALAVGIAIGAVGGYHARWFFEPRLVPLQSFHFRDQLSDQQVPYLAASGTWQGAEIANPINTVSILCDGAERDCRVTQADVYAPSGTAATSYLNLSTRSFRISKVDANSVVAEESLASPCVRQVLLLDRRAKSVSLVRTKVGKDDLCNMVQDAPLAIYLGSPTQ